MYNENRRRVQKRVNGVATNYYLHGKNVVHMTQGSDELHFFYDAQNKPAVVVYNGTAYAYLKNLQGDIVAILNGSGNAVVTYVYDAWGRPISKTGSMASTLGTLNPFRYRSYVYDEETGLYYLESRFYCPALCRFINCDATDNLGIGTVVLSFDLYTYCSSNPVRNADPTGEFAIGALLLSAVGSMIGGAIAGAIIGGVSYVVSTAISGDEFSASGMAHAVGLGAVSGAVGGLIGAEPFTQCAKGFFSLLTGAVVGFATGINTEGPLSEKVASGVSTGLISAACTFVGAQVGEPYLSQTASGIVTCATTLALGVPAEMLSVFLQYAWNDASDKEVAP